MLNGMNVVSMSLGTTHSTAICTKGHLRKQDLQQSMEVRWCMSSSPHSTASHACLDRWQVLDPAQATVAKARERLPMHVIYRAAVMMQTFIRHVMLVQRLRQRVADSKEQRATTLRESVRS